MKKSSVGHVVALLCCWLTVALSAQQTAPESEEARWSRMFAAQPAHIRWEPNEFLMSVASKLEPGDALDVGMGSGRNALYLARSGWNVTGFDLSTVGVSRAREQAVAEKLPLTAHRGDMFAYAYGVSRYDMVVLMYMGRIESLGERITDSLKPGGVLVIEHFDGGYEPGSLPKVFARLEVLQNTVEEAYPDYDQRTKGRVVRFLGRKPR
jgi:SAM-dependent methyltransferase